MGSATIRAVDGITLQIAAGEFVALLGASGSGKSSLLNLLAGLDSPSVGSVIVEGQSLSGLSREQLAKYRRHTVGMVFQSFNLIPSMSVLENVELPLRFAEVERTKRSAMAVSALEKVGLSGRLKHRPIELSGGEQQRVALARALINQPRILLADEPTGNLDSRTGTEVMNLIRQLNESLKMTVVLVTHERDLAEKYARRLIFLADGKVVADQPNSATAACWSSTMKLYDSIELAARNLRESVLRNSLTTLGISVGVASLVAMLSLGIGLQQLASRRLQRSGLFDSIVVTSRRNLRSFDREQEENGPAPAESPDLNEAARLKIASVAGVVEAYPDLRFITEVRFDEKPHLTMVAGLPMSSKDGDSFEGMQGKFFSSADAHEVILQKSFAAELLGKPAAEPRKSMSRKSRGRCWASRW